MEEIDFVVTWVDGNDPAWIEERDRYAGESGRGDSSQARYRDWNLLKYWFRGVEKFAPWVRMVHFVTWGHIPAWLNTDNPKLNIVKHEDFIPGKYLPTFNSHTIELNLHRIKGLAEHFVYFNDDMFLTSKTSPTLFFKNNLPCATFGLEVIKFRKSGIGTILSSNIALLNEHFFMRKVLKRNWRKVLNPKNGLKHVIKTGLLSLCTVYFPGLYDWHSAIAFNRSTFDKLWEIEEETLNATCMCRFRQKDNVSPYIFEYWQLAEGSFVPRGDRYSKTIHLKNDNVEDTVRIIKSGSYNIVCVNDTDELSDWEKAALMTDSAFMKILPDKSGYEL